MSLRSNTGRRGCFVQYIEYGMADLGQRKEWPRADRWSKEGE